MKVETVGPEIRRLLEHLALGETVTLVDADGAPLAIVVSLRSPRASDVTAPDWDARLATLAEQVSREWHSNRGALETLVEIRR